MSDAHTGESSAGSSFDARIDALCDEFEATWKRGDRQQIEGLLAEFDESTHYIALQELLQVEIELRSRHGETFSRAEYQQRFTGYEAVVEEIFAQLEMRGDNHEKILATQSPFDALPPSTSANPTPAGEDTVNFDREKLGKIEHFGTRDFEQGSMDAEKTRWVPPSQHHSLSERYVVIRSHAKGGMGLVSLAQDQELDRQVAFKELQEYCADDLNSRSRFVQEAEITGQLEHPGVVPVYGLGAYADGRPYYAMRFVQGKSLGEQITEFHNADLQSHDFSQGGLDFRALLGRLIDVCNAIAYAHSRGVLHRDIKPHNIMLGKFGETLVVDWGLAKAIGRQDSLASDEEAIQPTSGEGSTATRMGSATGTPAYMSPEQAAGHLNRLSPASDVYSLGATLYCLLTGVPPITGKSLTEVLRKAQRGDHQPPKLVNPRVPATIDSICCRAMSFQPEDRYQTPLELAADIERWFSDEATVAHQEKFFEKSARWFRRHRTWALAGAAALALVATVSLFAAIKINHSRQEAVAEKKIADELSEKNKKLAVQESEAKQQATARFKDSREAVDTWLTGFSEALSYYPGVQKFRERMLLQAAEDYERFVATEETDREMEIERGRALLRLGDVRRTLLQPDEAQQAYADAEAVFKKLTDKGGKQDAPLVELAQTMLRQAILASDLGKVNQAAAFYRRSIDAGQVIVDSQPVNEPALLTVTDARSRLGVLLATEGELDQANDLLQLSIEKQKVQVEQLTDSMDLLESLANTRIALGQLLVQCGDIARAQQQFELASQHYQVLIDKQADNPRYLQSRARALINLATTHRRAGRWDIEAQVYQQAIADYQNLIKAMPDVPVHRENLSLTQTDLGQLLRESFRTSEALDELTQARAVIENLAAEYPTVIRFHEERATCLDNLGEVLFDLGKYSESLAMHKQAEDVFGQLVTSVPDIVQYRDRYAISKSHLGVAYHALKQFELAEKEFQIAIESFKKYLALYPDSDLTLKSLAVTSEYFGDLLFEAGKREQAGKAYASAKGTWTKLIERLPQADYCHRAALFHVMCRSESIRDGKLAVQYACQALEAAPTNALYQGTLAAAHYRDKNFALAASLASESLSNRGGNLGRDYLFLAMAQHQQGQSSKAQESMDAATAWCAENVPGNLHLRNLKNEAKQLLASATSTSKSP